MGAPRKTHCLNGHPMVPENLYVKANGERCCRSCRKIRRKADRSTEAGKAATRRRLIKLLGGVE